MKLIIVTVGLILAGTYIVTGVLRARYQSKTRLKAVTEGLSRLTPHPTAVFGIRRRLHLALRGAKIVTISGKVRAGSKVQVRLSTLTFLDLMPTGVVSEFAYDAAVTYTQIVRTNNWLTSAPQVHVFVVLDDVMMRGWIKAELLGEFPDRSLYYDYSSADFITPTSSSLPAAETCMQRGSDTHNAQADGDDRDDVAQPTRPTRILDDQANTTPTTQTEVGYGVATPRTSTGLDPRGEELILIDKATADTHRFSLSGGVIGRGLDADAWVHSSRVTSSHARIRPENAGWTITDLGSTNGTFLNGQRVPSGATRLLHGGDELRLADVEFHVATRTTAKEHDHQ